jgi:hypothetical protein
MRWLAGPFRQSQQQTFLRRSKNLRTAQGVFLCQSSEVFEFFPTSVRLTDTAAVVGLINKRTEKVQKYRSNPKLDEKTNEMCTLLFTWMKIALM